jgi:hypothetical protein
MNPLPNHNRRQDGAYSGDEKASDDRGRNQLLNEIMSKAHSSSDAQLLYSVFRLLVEKQQDTIVQQCSAEPSIQHSLPDPGPAAKPQYSAVGHIGPPYGTGGYDMQYSSQGHNLQDLQTHHVDRFHHSLGSRFNDGMEVDEEHWDSGVLDSFFLLNHTDPEGRQQSSDIFYPGFQSSKDTDMALRQPIGTNSSEQNTSLSEYDLSHDWSLYPNLPQIHGRNDNEIHEVHPLVSCRK